MSTLKTNNVQVGQSVTATNNFTIYQPSSPDGTVRIGIGNSGATTGDVLTANSSGNVGIGTSSPDSLSNFRFLDVGSSGTNQGVVQANNGTVKVAIYANSTDGLVATRTAHNLNFQTNGSTRATIDTSGNLLINTTTARTSSGGLTVETDGTALYIGPKTTGAGNEGGELAFGRGTDKATAWTFDVLSGASPDIRIINASAVGVQIANGATSWSSYSDIRLKKNITPLRSVLEDIKSIECINYHLDNIDTDETPIRIGVSAQSLVGKFDEVVDETEVKGKEDLYYSVRYTDMVPVLVKAIQEQQAMIEELKAKVTALEGAKG
jgi:hypothetical protein